MFFENPSIRCELTPRRAPIEERLSSSQVTLGIRPEHVGVLESARDTDIRAKVRELESMGGEVVTALECGNEHFLALTSPENTPEAGAAHSVRFDPAKVHIFDRESERAIR